MLHMQHNEPMTTDATPPIADELSREIAQNCVLTRTRQISRVLTAVYDQEMRPFGLNATQFSMLALVLEFGPISRSELGRRNHQDRSTLTRNLQPLVEQELVAEQVPPGGGRRRPLTLTPQGHAILHRAAPGWSSAQTKAKELLGDEGARALMGIAGGLPRRKD